MSTETRTGGRRRRSRRPDRNQGGRRSDYRPSSKSKKQPEPKTTFWQKIVGFFQGENSQGASSPATDRATEPRKRERSPRRERSSGRKPEEVEVTSPRLYLGNLSFDAKESDIFDLFNGVGQVQNVEIVYNKHTMKSKGFAFVQMLTIEEAKRAVEQLHDKEYMGRKMVVSGAKALDDRESERTQADRQPEQ